MPLGYDDTKCQVKAWVDGKSSSAPPNEFFAVSEQTHSSREGKGVTSAPGQVIFAQNNNTTWEYHAQCNNQGTTVRYTPLRAHTGFIFDAGKRAKQSSVAATAEVGP